MARDIAPAAPCGRAPRLRLYLRHLAAQGVARPWVGAKALSKTRLICANADMAVCSWCACYFLVAAFSCGATMSLIRLSMRAYLCCIPLLAKSPPEFGRAAQSVAPTILIA